MQKNLVRAVTLASCLALASCRREGPSSVASAPSTTNTQLFAVKGIVRGLDPAQREVKIEHEAIPGFMGQMTMPFTVKETNLLTDLLVGDAVSFRMWVTPDEGWIDQIVKIPLTNVALQMKPRPPVREVRLVEPLKLGDTIPDYHFTNQLGQSFGLAEFKGQALGITFIFTRCPFPNFCPRMSSHFREACQKLTVLPDGPPTWHLLTVSFDPDHDTPAVLKTYAEAYQADAKRWTFATGAMIDIDAITEQFGMFFAPDGAFFSHNVRTAVIDTRGRVQRIFAGNEWPVDDFVAEMVKAAEAK